MRLHHVQLAIPPGAEDECRRFYLDKLGLTEVTKPATLAGRGGLWVRAARLEAHGVPVTWDESFPGYRRFYACDNVGNRLEFLTPS